MKHFCRCILQKAWVLAGLIVVLIIASEDKVSPYQVTDVPVILNGYTNTYYYVRETYSGGTTPANNLRLRIFPMFSWWIRIQPNFPRRFRGQVRGFILIRRASNRWGLPLASRRLRHCHFPFWKLHKELVVAGCSISQASLARFIRSNNHPMSLALGRCGPIF
jgi:hypothetical protein